MPPEIIRVLPSEFADSQSFSLNNSVPAVTMWHKTGRTITIVDLFSTASVLARKGWVNNTAAYNTNQCSNQLERGSGWHAKWYITIINLINCTCSSTGNIFINLVAVD